MQLQIKFKSSIRFNPDLTARKFSTAVLTNVITTVTTGLGISDLRYEPVRVPQMFGDYYWSSLVYTIYETCYVHSVMKIFVKLTSQVSFWYIIIFIILVYYKPFSIHYMKIFYLYYIINRILLHSKLINAELSVKSLWKKRIAKIGRLNQSTTI